MNPNPGHKKGQHETKCKSKPMSNEARSDFKMKSFPNAMELNLGCRFASFALGSCLFLAKVFGLLMNSNGSRSHLYGKHFLDLFWARLLTN